MGVSVTELVFPGSLYTFYAASVNTVKEVKPVLERADPASTSFPYCIDLLIAKRGEFCGSVQLVLPYLTR